MKALFVEGDWLEILLPKAIPEIVDRSIQSVVEGDFGFPS